MINTDTNGILRDMNVFGLWLTPLMGILSYIGAYALPQILAGKPTKGIVVFGAIWYAIGVTIGLIDYYRANIKTIEKMIKKNLF